MKQLLTLILCAITLSQFSCGNTTTPIIIDGSFNDWNAVADTVTDPIDDAAPDAFADFRSVRATADNEFVHLLVDFGRPVNIQRLTGTAIIALDVDGNPNTGDEMHGLAGVDVTVTLTAPNARRQNLRGMGIGVASTTFTPTPEQAHAPSGMISPYDIGFTFGPTYQSDVVEFRMRRGSEIPHSPILFANTRFSAVVAAFDSDRAVLDTAGPITVDLPPLVSPQPATALIVPRAPDALRVVSWNVEFSALLRQPDHFVPVLRALKPDVLLLQELDQKTTSAQLTAFLNEHLGDARTTWTALVGAGGGNLRSGVASRLPMTPAPNLHRLEYRDRPDRTIRHASAHITFHDRTILVTSLHLRCCGDAESYEEEVRLMEVDVLGEALRASIADSSADGLILGGDFNLVGGRAPLDNLAQQLDIDGSDLTTAQPMKLDGRSNATWADTEQAFVPGRLDYIQYSDASLRAERAFVFDAADIHPHAASDLGFHFDSTAKASDHLPVVVDFSWTKHSTAQSK